MPSKNSPVKATSRRESEKVEKNIETEELNFGADRISPAILGMLMMAGAGLLGLVALGSLQIHAMGMELEAKESAVYGFQQSGNNITFEQYDEFIDDMRGENYYLIAGIIGGVAAVGMAGSSILFLNRRRPAAEVGIASNILAIIQAQWTSSIGSGLGSNIAPGLGNTYFLMGVTHSLVAGCCLLFVSSMVLTSAGRNSLRPWSEPDIIPRRKQKSEAKAEDE
ncbi:MAG TPA: hypothetical protein EYQ53_05550 [Candidatus Poseidoniales archaeon]|jgi:hypothetical protein|nr:MAG: hypothetical protein CXT67_00860 [Euryarchaeota archaeon]HIG03826.1 hypothetical protein [Candidatus Poseidoniales archaeon]HIK78834.1 hypothetical protein [Candidatus Poseidoniales archaeon]